MLIERKTWYLQPLEIGPHKTVGVENVVYGTIANKTVNIQCIVPY